MWESTEIFLNVGAMIVSVSLSLICLFKLCSVAYKFYYDWKLAKATTQMALVKVSKTIKHLYDNPKIF